MSKSPSQQVVAAIRKARAVSFVLPLVMWPALMLLIGSVLVLFVYLVAAVLERLGLIDAALLVDMNMGAVWLVALLGALLCLTGSVLVRLERKLWSDVVNAKAIERIDKELF